MTEMLKLIHSRKSVRHFRTDSVKRNDLIEMVKENVLKILAKALPYAKMLADVNAAIVVLGDSSVKSPSGHTYWLQDTCAATQNILLAAEALNLGAVWTALYPYEERMQPVIEACQIPVHLIPLNIIPIGVPTGEDKPKDKYKPEKIHLNQWKNQ